VSQNRPVLTTTPEELAEWPMANALPVARICQHLLGDGPNIIVSRAVCCAPLVYGVTRFKILNISYLVENKMIY
jgi:hypothetical protein